MKVLLHFGAGAPMLTIEPSNQREKALLSAFGLGEYRDFARAILSATNRPKGTT